MKLFDEVIEEVYALASASVPQKLNKSWEKGDQNQILFRNETAFELGGGSLPAIAGILFTDSEALVPKDEVVVLGPDIPDMHKDSPYARIAVIQVDDEKLGTGNRVYPSLRKIDYVRYHLYPKHAMVRISSMNKRESIAIGKKAVKENLAALGRLWIDAYHEIPSVKAVKLIFITDPAFSYERLQAQLDKAENITKALDHLLSKVKMDCHSCSLQEICAEVEEMIDKDFTSKS